MIRYFILALALLCVAGPAFAALVVETTSSGSDSSSDTITVTLPTGIVSGNLLVCGISADGGGNTITSVTWPAGWTERADTDFLAAVGSVGTRLADGSEGASINVTGNGSSPSTEDSVYKCFRISGNDTGNTGEIATANNTTGANPDPPNLAPSWGATDTLWLIFAFGSSAVAITACDSNYTTNFTEVHPNPSLATSWRVNNAASEDPGACTGGSADWMGATFAVKPAVAAGASSRSLLLGVGQ